MAAIHDHSAPEGPIRRSDGVIDLAVNYSPQAAELLRRGAVELDRFKCPPWPELIAAAGGLRPPYVHFDFQAGQGPPSNVDLELAAGHLLATGTYFVNTHLAPPLTDDDFETLSTRVSDDVRVLVERFGAARVMVENVPWEPRVDRRAVSPALLRRVVEASGAGFLLDLAHARWTAELLGLDVRESVAALPVERLCELHVTGLGWDAAGRRRDHLPLLEPDLELLAWALDHIAAGRWSRPWAVALEYGGIGPLFEWRSDAAVLARDLPRLAAMLAERGLR